MRAGRGIVAARRALIDLMKRQRDEGVSHVAFNMKIARQPAKEILDEPGEYVLPSFCKT